MKTLLLRAAGRLPANLWRRAAGTECLLPYYHVVGDEPLPHVSPLYRFRTCAEFRADLDCLLRGRRALSLAEFVAESLRTGIPPSSSFLLTFDDGFREMYEVVLPLLRAKGVPAVFFLNPSSLDNQWLCHHQQISVLLHRLAQKPAAFPAADVVQLLRQQGVFAEDAATGLRALRWSQRDLVQEIANRAGVDFKRYLAEQRPYLTSAQVDSIIRAGMAIGAHSLDHPRYAEISLQEQLRQTRESLRLLGNRYPLDPATFAFPHTDRGVSRSFFQALATDDSCVATFGTSAPQRDDLPGHFQRFSMEKTALPAEAILARHLLRSLRHRALGRPPAPRP